VTDADVEAYYNENSDSFRQEEQRKVAHILIEFADDEAAAKTKIETVKARLAQGEDFAALAKELSDDVFSGENGGDLDWLEPGAMEETFEQAAVALTEVGSTSDIVKTSFGYHVIKLTDKKAEVVKSLAAVRDELFAKISNERAQDKFFELQQEMARISFEFPDSLDDVAAEIKGQVQTSSWLSRGVNTAPFDQPKVIEAAFSDLVLQDNMNSDVIEVTDSIVMVLRLNTYQEAKVKPLTEVTAQITTLLTNDKATTKAQNTVDELLIQFKAGNDITEQLTALNAKFEDKVNVKRYASDLDQSIVRKAFVLPHPIDGEVSAASVSLSNGDLAVVEVKAVAVADVPMNPNLAKQQTSQLAQSAYKSYVDSLKSEAKITRRELAAPVSAY
jgi:peptidyl-prolyl cis-trans isomerase D